MPCADDAKRSETPQTNMTTAVSLCTHLVPEVALETEMAVGSETAMQMARVVDLVVASI